MSAKAYAYQQRLSIPYKPLPLLEAVSALINAIFGIFYRAKQIEVILKAESAKSILACSGDLIDLPASLIAGRRRGIPFIAYMFDDYRNQWSSRAFRLLAFILERFVAPRSDGVIVPNEFLAREYRERYGIDAIIIPNPIEVFGYVSPVPRTFESKRSIRMVYTGAIYEAQRDAIQNLLEAMPLVRGHNFEFHAYTSQTRTDFERLAITGPIFRHSHLSRGEIVRIQQDADILFLPLAFNSPIHEVIRTSAPAKMGEYLASGRPTLVHAPFDTFVSKYFREHNCGLVVNSQKPDDLANAIMRLIQDEQLCRRLVRNARTRAQADFSLKAAQDAFIKALAIAQ